MRVRLVVHRSHSSAIVADRRYQLIGTAPGLSGALDRPFDGEVIDDGLLVVGGWAHMGRTVSRVDVWCDGELLGRARIGENRDDVPGELGPTAGFGLCHSVAGTAPRTRRIAVSVTDFDGRTAHLASAGVTLSRAGSSAIDAADGARLRELNRLAIERTTRPRRHGGRKLLVFAHSLALGGAELYLQELLRRIAPLLESCTVVANVGGPLGAGLEAIGIDVAVDGRGRATTVAEYESRIGRLAEVVIESGADAVLVNTVIGFDAADAAERVGTPTIWAIHESLAPLEWLREDGPDVTRPPYLVERLEAALAGASRLVFVAEATRALYAPLTGPSGHSLVVPYGIDTQPVREFEATFDRRQRRAALGIADDAVVLLCAGVFAVRKSQSSLISAFLRVADSNPDAMLILVGDRGGGYSRSLRALVEPAGEAGSRVRFVPTTEDMASWYGLADVLVSASDIESLPRSMLEAMAFGLPVLATSVFGVPELVVDGENGWLVEPRDLTALVDGLRRVLDLDSATRRQIGAAGRRLVNEHFDSSGYATEYLRLIDELTTAPDDGT